jgi:hypothetical protein
MPSNITPIFTGLPVIGTGQLTVANANRDGTTGTYVSLVTGGANGTRITRITIQAAATTTLGQVRLFIDNGVNVRLWKEIPVTALTPSGTVLGFNWTLELLGERAMNLPPNYILKACTANAEALNVIVEGGNY